LYAFVNKLVALRTACTIYIYTIVIDELYLTYQYKLLSERCVCCTEESVNNNNWLNYIYMISKFDLFTFRTNYSPKIERT